MRLPSFTASCAPPSRAPSLAATSARRTEAVRRRRCLKWRKSSAESDCGSMVTVGASTSSSSSSSAGGSSSAEDITLGPSNTACLPPAARSIRDSPAPLAEMAAPFAAAPPVASPAAAASRAETFDASPAASRAEAFASSAWAAAPSDASASSAPAAVETPGSPIFKMDGNGTEMRADVMAAGMSSRTTFLPRFAR